MVVVGQVSNRLAALAIALIGVLLLLLVVRLSFSTVSFLGSATHAEGVVVGDAAGGTHPVIQFQASDGKTVEYVQGGLIFGKAKGAKLDILYNPSNPAASATINSFGTVWFWEIVLSAIAFVMIAGGAVTFLVKKG